MVCQASGNSMHAQQTQQANHRVAAHLPYDGSRDLQLPAVSFHSAVHSYWPQLAVYVHSRSERVSRAGPPARLAQTVWVAVLHAACCNAYCCCCCCCRCAIYQVMQSCKAYNPGTNGYPKPGQSPAQACRYYSKSGAAASPAAVRCVHNTLCSAEQGLRVECNQQLRLLHITVIVPLVSQGGPAAHNDASTSAVHST